MSKMAQKSKPKLNAFSLFMRERRRDLEAEGKTFTGGWKEVANSLDHEWGQVPEEQRNDYRRRAEAINNGGLSSSRTSCSSGSSGGEVEQGDLRKTSFGVTFQALNDEAQARNQALMKHGMELKKDILADPLKVTFCLIRFSIYGQLRKKVYVPAEVGMTSFNLEDGIIDNYQSMIDPFEIPIGLGIEARQTAKTLAVPIPPYDNRFQDYLSIIQAIENFLNRQDPVERKQKVYCLREDMEVVQACLDWLYAHIPECDLLKRIQVHSLGEAIRVLSFFGVVKRADRERRYPGEVINDLVLERRKRDYKNMMKMDAGPNSEIDEDAFKNSIVMREPDETVKFKAGVFNYEGQVEDFLNSLDWAYDPEIACIYHQLKDEGVNTCPLNITNRYAYKVLDAMTLLYNIEPKVTRHIPDIPGNPANELKRRTDLLDFWGIRVRTDREMKYDPKKKHPTPGSLFPKFGPDRPGAC